MPTDNDTPQDPTDAGTIHTPVALIEAVKAALPLHVYTNGYEWWIAESVDAAKDLCLENIGDPSPETLEALEDIEGDGWEELADDAVIGMFRDEEREDYAKQTCAAWIAEQGRGFLCTTED